MIMYFCALTKKAVQPFGLFPWFARIVPANHAPDLEGPFLGDLDRSKVGFSGTEVIPAAYLG